MKFLKIFLFICLVHLSSCINIPSSTTGGHITVNAENRPVVIVGATVNSDGKVDSSSCDSKGIPYRIYYLQGCEYIRFGQGEYIWGAHSGLCPNPIHKYNSEKN